MIMKSFTSILVLAALLVGLMSGCSSQKVANDQNIADAVSHYLESERGGLCLQLH